MNTTPDCIPTGFRLSLLPGALCLLIALTGAASAKPGDSKDLSSDFAPPARSDRSVVPGERRAPIEIVVAKAPPTLPFQVDFAPPRPSRAHVWVPGYWTWESNTYTWVSGAWLPPPGPAAIWIAPRFEKRKGVNVFISGY